MSLRTSIRDGILRLTLDRPDKKNALDQGMYRDLAAALNAGAEDPLVRVARIDGAGDVFCAGNDIGDFQNGKLTGLDGPIGDFLWALSTFPKPLIGVAHGAAVGIGTTMLLHCDLVYAAAGTKFVLPFVNLALVPEGASTILFPGLVGHHRAAELFFFGEPLPAERALELGLVNAVLPRHELEGHVEERARTLADKPLRSLVTTKKLMKSHDWDAIHAAMKREADFFVAGLGSPEAREAFAAFFERRPPDFRQFS